MIAFSSVWIPVACTLIFIAWCFWPRDEDGAPGNFSLMYRLLGLIPVLLVWVTWLAWRAWGLS